MAGYGSPSAAAPHSKANGLAIASLACGIIGLVLFNVLLGPVAIVLGAVGVRQASAKGGGGMAKAGIVLGVIDLVVFGILLAVAAPNGGFAWYVGG